jgi:chorismate synthase
MSGSTFGKLFRVTTFGESHGTAMGCIIDGCPAGLELSHDDISNELLFRRPGIGSRFEEDTAEILSGIYEGKTIGSPITIIVRNKNQNPQDYENLKDIFRPGHADYTWQAKYGLRDHRGGGRSSGRETVSRVVAGAVAKKILALQGIIIKAHAEDIKYDLKKLNSEKDSAGGIIACRVTDVPAGLGEPVFDKLDARLASAIISIGACKGIEFGAGFAAAEMKGSQNNDLPDKSGGGKFATNNCGGILGGISSGQDIYFRAAFKPAPSIGKPQTAYNKDGGISEVEIQGRYDTCIVPRAVSVVEAMTALVLADFLLLSQCNRI